MTPLEMLDIRNKIEDALKPLGWKGVGAGVGMCGQPSADIEGTLDGKRLIIEVKVRSETYSVPLENEPQLVNEPEAA